MRLHVLCQVCGVHMVGCSACLPLCRVPGEPVELVRVEEGAAVLQWLPCRHVQLHAGQHGCRCLFRILGRESASAAAALLPSILAHMMPC